MFTPVYLHGSSGGAGRTSALACLLALQLFLGGCSVASDRNQRFEDTYNTLQQLTGYVELLHANGLDLASYASVDDMLAASQRVLVERVPKAFSTDAWGQPFVWEARRVRVGEYNVKITSVGPDGQRDGIANDDVTVEMTLADGVPPKTTRSWR